MHVFRAVLAVSGLILSSVACATAPRPSLALELNDALLGTIVENASVSVRVDVFRHGHGSGVVVSKDGLIVTCEHIVRHVGRADVVATVSDGRGHSLPAKVLATDPARDLALLKVDATFRRTAVLTRSVIGSQGERIYGIGFPGTKGRTITPGIIKRHPFSVDMRPGEPANFKEGILAEMSASGGSSGQGVFSAETGQLLGVHKMSFRDDENDRSVLISADEIRAFLKENDINLK